MRTKPQAGTLKSSKEDVFVHLKHAHTHTHTHIVYYINAPRSESSKGFGSAFTRPVLEEHKAVRNVDVSTERILIKHE